jgi:hypothetical protein
MTTLREAAAAVLVAYDTYEPNALAMEELRAALAEPAIKPDLTTEPVAWAMPRSDGLILDVICPDEHEAYEGEYTVPLCKCQPKAGPEPYDQTALELCEVCGWKTLIPTEGCLNCERQPKAEPEPVACEKEVKRLRSSLDFYKRRADALQKAQQQMRDPERTMVCDILANGCLLVPAGGRYTAPQPKAWYGVSPMFGTVAFDSYQAALDGGFDNPLPLIEAAVWGDGK